MGSDLNNLADDLDEKCRDIRGVSTAKPSLCLHSTAVPVFSATKPRGVPHGRRITQRSVAPQRYSCNQLGYGLSAKRHDYLLNSESTLARIASEEILQHCSAKGGGGERAPPKKNMAAYENIATEKLIAKI
ncbi:hypothetical protein IEQ34_007908 [Dendrobium chrysotoxum]|uniref:Uncharacterized protein n=1 Tax=Dendrobium chrysotoxum TaxID=161865 RepID=A0AAV7H4C8_DENCH|nr:hypothetical protein IEQ34_007908 [Dendrobium chrysotoxum]